MSKTIWKYKLPGDGATIQIHEYIVEVLHIAAQDGIPTLWAIVDPDRPRDGYTEVVAWGTGWPLPDDVYQETDYWGSCEDGYGYIWHYFAAARYEDRNNWLNDIDYSQYDSLKSNGEEIKDLYCNFFSLGVDTKTAEDNLNKLIELYNNAESNKLIELYSKTESNNRIQ